MTFTLPPRDEITFVQARSVAAGVAQDALALAGSRHLCWEDALLLSRDGRAVRRAASSFDPAMKAALSAARAPICGLVADRPLVMGILNVTPDSFSDGGRHSGLEAAVTRAEEMSQEADIIDIGGESTRPGAHEVPEAEEIARITPAIRAIRAAGITTPISIDTRKASVAEAALDAGADIINDVTALRFDARMAALTAERGVPVVLMHSVATPETMQANAQYDDVLWSVRDHLYQQLELALAAGIRAENIILDPGIGFGKTTAHDLHLMRHLSAFHDFGLNVLLGASRKKFIGAITGTSLPAERVAGSVAIALQGAAMGAQILRVHDTKETSQALAIWRALSERQGEPAHGA